jgi:hypothetical protein
MNHCIDCYAVISWYATRCKDCGRKRELQLLRERRAGQAGERELRLCRCGCGEEFTPRKGNQKNITGHSKKAHDERKSHHDLVVKYCQCGAAIDARKRKCDACKRRLVVNYEKRRTADRREERAVFKSSVPKMTPEQRMAALVWASRQPGYNPRKPAETMMKYSEVMR